MEKYPSFEMGPSRPPSESRSLLMRLTRSCPWNRCEFCTTNKGKPFSLRTVEEIKRDIETVKTIQGTIYAHSTGSGIEANKRAVARVHENPPNESFWMVSQWLFYGGKTVFLQDANSIVLRTPDMVEVLKFLKQTLSTVERITSYGSSKVAAHKSLEELKEIHEAGLSRLHIGIESGCDEVLKYVRKGASAEEHIRAGKNVVASGISLSDYVMPGLGGKKWSQKHARETARVINEIAPDFIRLRSLALREDLPLYEKYRSGEFELLSDDETVMEIAEFVGELNVGSNLLSDHIENLLPEIEGKLPEDKGKILGVINRYLSLPPEERIIYRLGRRTGNYNDLGDLGHPAKRAGVEKLLQRIQESGKDVEGFIFNLKQGYLV
ncbi:MAG: radical SAM protein [Syntrophales bacterium]|nr:radical SAM protein [Syntrophales bacterium]